MSAGNCNQGRRPDECANCMDCPCARAVETSTDRLIGICICALSAAVTVAILSMLLGML